VLISTAAAPRSGSADVKFTFKETTHTIHFHTDRYASECRTTLSVKVFTQRNYAADFVEAKCNFTRKMAILRF